MILFVSDMHFGRAEHAAERANEDALVACLRAFEAHAERLFLLGDVFDPYIEYRALVPRGFVRFQALLAQWTDRGVPVTYLVGNHDPWHRDYFAQELGVGVVFDEHVERLDGRRVYLNHGDGLAPGDRVYRHLKPWLRHPVPVWIYRTVLPADAGFRLARWVSRRFGGQPPDPATRDAFRRHARHVLNHTAADLVVMGHSHLPDLQRWPEGAYLNTGCWHTGRTFGCLDKNGPKLLHWNGEQAVEVDAENAARTT